MKTKTVTAAPQQSGWTIDEWCAAVKIARPTYYTFPETARPESVCIGKRRVIFESPGDWLRRMADAGGVVTTRLADREVEPA